MAVLIIQEPDGHTNHIEPAQAESTPVPETGGARVAINGPRYDAVLHLDCSEAEALGRGLLAACGCKVPEQTS